MKVDTASTLTQAKRDIKVLNYQLTQIVTTANDRKNTIIPHNTMDIEVMEDTLMTFKVPSRNQYCPLRVQITYNDAKTSPAFNDLKVFVSLDTREPNEHDCYRSYLNVTSYN